jgi:hypothetical protein
MKSVHKGEPVNITWKLGGTPADSNRRAETITISLTPEDDPDGHIVGLLMRDRLEAFLAAYPRPADGFAGCRTQDEAYTRLTAFAFVANMCASRLDGMQLEARDRWGMGWGTIASAVDSSRQTVKDQILRIRRSYIDSGAWYGAAGLHRGTPAEAYEATGHAVGTNDDAGDDQS